MRLIRIRFTVGTLLFTVAVVAADSWALRDLTKTHTYMCGSYSYRLLPASVGALPLVNAMLIGVWLVVARRLRSTHRRGAASPQSTLSRVTYFSLHFLVLGALVALFIPDAVELSQGVAEVATEYAAVGWGAVFGEAGETISWLIFESLFLGLVISGPPLLLSWIGQALARRSAATLPWHRFRAMACLVSLGFAGTDLAIALTPQPFEDEQAIDLEFQVVDRVSGRVIPAAFVCMTDPFPHDPTSYPPRALTDREGRVRLTGRFTVSGRRNAFRLMGSFSPWGRWLEVSAAGHRTRRTPLTDVLGPCADPTYPGLGKVALDRGTTPEDSFRDLAGSYSLGYGNGGSWFTIEPDGRFAWGASGCTFHILEYGRLSRCDREIEFHPIPHAGEETHPLLTRRFRVIEWGDRLYLALADEEVLRRFCRRALFPNRPPRFEILRVYPRESDFDKPQRGLPRVPPKVWAGVLADELNLGNEEGSLRLAFDRLIAVFPSRSDGLLLRRVFRFVYMDAGPVGPQSHPSANDDPYGSSGKTRDTSGPS